MATGFVYHPKFHEHFTGLGHPECHQRLQWIIRSLDASPVRDRVERVEPTKADERWLLEVHTAKHVDRVRRACAAPQGAMLDLDTVVSPASWDAAVLAVGAQLLAADQIMSGAWRNAFCAVRPPGHHAESDAAMGFCLFNNAAIGTRYLQRRHGVKRVLIIDWDVHHGNGTQEIFYSDPTVFYFSTHQFPYYPGTGAATERGEGPGLGYTLNVPLPGGAADEDYLKAFEEILVPAARQFQPEVIVVSAGFDPHADDPMAAIQLTDEGFQRLGKIVVGLADELCQGRLLATLEGGYHLTTLGRCVVQFLEVLLASR
jgi:acetoin utilization deacetylase AcuC-like enzyme